MVLQAIVDISFRWLHVIAAALAIGGAFFQRFVLPRALESIEPVGRDAALLRFRRSFKMIVHPAILIFLVTGTYNAWRNWPVYTMWPGVMHGMFGMHLLLALSVIGLLLWLLASREVRRSGPTWMRATVYLMLLTVLMGSGLKWMRDRTVMQKYKAAIASPMPAATQPAPGAAQ
jgi:uncharacterized membrane protein